MISTLPTSCEDITAHTQGMNHTPEHQQQPAAAEPPEGVPGMTPNPMMLQYPLKDITTPHPHDVLCGRGEYRVGVRCGAVEKGFFLKGTVISHQASHDFILYFLY